MCGITLYNGSDISTENSMKSCANIRHRGPDFSSCVQISSEIFMGFHRLMVNGLEYDSNQPFKMGNHYLICNGEIYNYQDLSRRFDIQLKTKSDCEIIIHLYRMFGIENALRLLDGEFAFALYDSSTNEIHAARDPIGVRSLYFGRIYKKGVKSEYIISSEMKSMLMCNNISQFTPGHYCTIKDRDVTFSQYCNYLDRTQYPFHESHDLLFTKLDSAVKKRMMSDRSIGCLLSGGLDSSIVTALACKYIDNVNTYAIGLEGSVDLAWARKVSDYLGTTHHECVLKEADFIEAIDDTIYCIESYDTTTVRASIGNRLVSQFVKKIGKDAVLLVGDVSDELFGSYRGMGLTDSSNTFQAENEKLIKNIHYFDILRSDKTISSAGLEARVPFSDLDFMSYVMSISPELKMFNNNNMEKAILRDAFKGVLPDDVLYRRKEAFSDGVSSENRGLYEILKEYFDSVISDLEYSTLVKTYDYLPQFKRPYDKESLYYRIVYEKFYPKTNAIPYYWKQPCSSAIDPSARVLSNYVTD